MILNCSDLSISFGDKDILKDVSFHVEEMEKAAIVGMNGAGKSTLLKAIVHEILPDGGNVSLEKGKTIGYLAQQVEFDDGASIYQEVLGARQDLLQMEETLRDFERRMALEKGEGLDKLMEQYHALSQEFEDEGGLTFRSEAAGVLKGLGFQEEEFGKTIDELSGGQKTRTALARLLISKPDLLLLDEPTNHLDIDSITWLEGFLQGYKGAVLIVAHDRYFLDKVVTKVIEIENGHSHVFSGNYSDYAVKKREMRVAQMHAYLNQQRQIRHEEQVIAKLRQFNREKSIKRAQSREKKLEKIEEVEKPAELDGRMRLSLTPRRESGKDVLQVEGLAKSFEGQELFSGLSFSVYKGERVALLGGNGTGKTTILKILMGLLDADNGMIKLGTGVEIGYYDQEHQGLNPDNTLMEEISDAYPDMDNTTIRNTLALFLFTDDDVFKRVSDLSGGEKGRLSMAKLMLSGANFLLLDEPTNHLDMVSKEVLEDVLRGYTGTVFFVSHDRYFINQVATRILHLSGRKLTNYIGNYDYYLEKKDILEAPEKQQAADGRQAAGRGAGNAAGGGTDSSQATGASGSREDWEQQKKKKARQKKKEAAVQKAEEKVTELEAKKEKLEEELSDPKIAAVSAELNRISKEIADVDEALSQAYEEWESLAMEL
jgi:ATP-binding cassette subfamily F protein 3